GVRDRRIHRPEGRQAALEQPVQVGTAGESDTPRLELVGARDLGSGEALVRIDASGPAPRHGGGRISDQVGRIGAGIGAEDDAPPRTGMAATATAATPDIQGRALGLQAAGAEPDGAAGPAAARAARAARTALTPGTARAGITGVAPGSGGISGGGRGTGGE